MLRSAGYTLLELILALAVVVVVCATSVPQMTSAVARARGLAAVRYLAARMTLARMQAVAWNAAVALRFEQTSRGIAFSIYRDGDRDGVQTVDIDGGIDREIEPSILLSEQFPGVEIGLAPGTASRDPVHIGRTSLLSFSPLGGATSGTIYVLGRDGTQWAVRVLGATGRTRVLRQLPAADEWLPAF